jgi:hypothetical protein
MGNLRTSLALAVLGLAACGSNAAKTPDAAPPKPDAAPIDSPPPTPDSPPPPDAPAYDFSCLGQPLPTTAPATVSVSGTVEEVAISGVSPGINPLSGASLVACANGAADCMNANQLATATSDMTGAYTVGPITTNGAPVDAYVHLTHTGDRPTDEYPASPIAATLSGVPIITFQTTAFSELVTYLHITQDDANGNLTILVTDCAGTAIGDSANLTLSVQQNGADVPNTTVLDGGQLSSMAAGIYFVFNVPPGATAVSATYKGMNLLAHTVGAVAQETTATEIKPGP